MLHRIAFATVATLLLLGGTAHASSLVYVKDHNVWVANPDGSGQRQLTTDGLEALPYESPSQADDGTILATRGSYFVKLDRQGSRIGDPLPSILVGKPANAYAFGPFDAKISPDGKKLVYWVGTWSTWFDHGTNTSWTDPKDAVIWQDAVSGAQLGFTMFYEEPSWLQDSSRALLNQGGNRNAPQIAVSAIGANHNDVQHVFSDHDSRPPGETFSVDVADPEITPAGDKLAAVRGMGAETLRFYDTRGDRPVVSVCHFTQPVGGSFAGPTWAPDGSALAWQEGDGIWASPVPATVDGTDCGWGRPELIIPGGTDPDWGPADAAVVASTPPSPAPTEAPSSGAPPPSASAPAPVAFSAPAAGALVVSARRTVARGTLLRRGLAVTVTAARPGAARATLRLGRTVVAQRTRRVQAGRSAVLRLTPARGQRARVRRARAVELRVSGAGATHTQRVVLRG